MTVPTFAVTAEMVRTSFFPHLLPFSTTTNPTSAAVTREINWAAADLEGRLLAKSVTASAITDATSAAYYWCQYTIALTVAVSLIGVMSGADPELAKRWAETLGKRIEALETQGVTAIGSGATASGGSEALGPTDHISELDLDVGDTALASSVEPYLRRDDLL